MKKLALVVLLLFSVLAWAGGELNPADYTINVHVSSSRMVQEGKASYDNQWLNATIDGKKYELKSYLAMFTLLALGDYKAKLVKDDHRTTYDSYRVYEFLFPDNKTRKFVVVGTTE